MNENLKEENDWNFEKINSLQYLSAFIKESLRLGSPGPLGLFKELNEDCKMGDHIFKKNTKFFAGFIANFFNEKYFEKPEEFNPERWLKNGVIQENINDEPGSYIPFSLGPRNCIGSQFALIESKVIIMKFIKYFDFKLLTKSIMWRLAVTYGPFNQVLFKLKKRE